MLDAPLWEHMEPQKLEGDKVNLKNSDISAFHMGGHTM